MAEDELPPSYTPQALEDILPIYHASTSTDNVETYTLRQTGPFTQILYNVHHTGPNTQDLSIRLFETGGFMNKKPHVILSRVETAPVDHAPVQRRRSIFSSREPPTSSSQIIAEGRFDPYGKGTSINYTSRGGDNGEEQGQDQGPLCQRLELYNSSLQILRTTIDGLVHYWQPHPGNDSVLELVDEAEDTIARFTYAGPSGRPLRQGSWSSETAESSVAADPSKQSKRKEKEKVNGEVEIGTLEVVIHRVQTPQAKQEVRCTAVMVVERTRRRKVNIGYGSAGKLSVGGTVPLGGPMGSGTLSTGI